MSGRADLRIELGVTANHAVRCLLRGDEGHERKVERQTALADAMGELAEMMLAEQEGARNEDHVQA